MNCEACGTELPEGAMFCGECGRAVATRTGEHVDSGMPVSGAPSRDQPAGSNDTNIIDPVDLALLSWEPSSGADLENDSPGDPTATLAEEGSEPKVDENAAGSEPLEPVEQDLPPDIEEQEERADETVGDDVVDADESPVYAEEADSIPVARPDPFPWGDRGSAIFSDSDDLEQTLIVPRREQGERFVLQFSTGESVTVFGTGLLGRNPMPQPGEYFDHLVVISDPGKSVSKTHLEFGQESGAFWISDRYSGNGSIVREPETAARRVTPGKRYRVVRGSRIDIGEQFFIVS